MAHAACISETPKLTFEDLALRFLYGDRTTNPGRKSSPYQPERIVANEPNPPGCRGLRTNPVQRVSVNTCPVERHGPLREQIMSRKRSRKLLAEAAAVEVQRESRFKHFLCGMKRNALVHFITGMPTR